MRKILPFVFLLLLISAGTRFFFGKSLLRGGRMDSSDSGTDAKHLRGGEATTSTPARWKNQQIMSLPGPRTKSEVSLEETIANRRSKRGFSEKPLTLAQLSQILWAAQGITNKQTGFRTAPSAGALYPLEIYIAVKENGVEDLKAGVCHYLPESHSIEVIKEGDLSQHLAQAALGQSFVADAAINVVIAAEYERTTGKYGDRGTQYVHMEAGHVGQNIYLQVESLGLGTVTVGAFHDEDVTKLLNLPENHQPLSIMPIGHPK